MMSMMEAMKDLDIDKIMENMPPEMIEAMK